MPVPHGVMQVGIFLFHEVEVLDFAGPFEVFSLAEHPESAQKIFRVHTISEQDVLLGARNGLKVKADFQFTNHPALKVVRERKYVDAGNVVTSGGISAGIEMSLYLVVRLAGKEIALATARRMEYGWLSDCA